jgi:hypothetical protein
MAALNDYVIQVLADPIAFPADQWEVGIAPVLVGQVIAAGTGAPGTDWNVLWNNGAVSIDHDNTILRVLAQPLKTEFVGRKARPAAALGNVSPGCIGTIRIRDANDIYVLEREDGTFYTLSQANLQLLN